MTIAIDAREPVVPRLHPTLDFRRAVDGGDLRDDAIVQSIAFYAVGEDWQSLWNLADSLKREVSVLFDEQGLIWVDIGSTGRVALSPPNGSRIPFQLWIHTHPWDAYWSITDKETLSIATGILEKALVLGHDHLVRTVHHEGESTEASEARLATGGPLMHWTAEAAMSYATFKQERSVA